MLRDDASSTAAGITGETKDLLVAHGPDHLVVLAAGASGERPDRQGTGAAWHLDHHHLVRDTRLISRNGDETRVRAVLTMPGTSTDLLTIGFARNDTAMIGQVLAWNLTAPTR